VSTGIRLLTEGDEDVLREYLYMALLVPEGHPALPREILQEPPIARYVDGWGREGDLGVLASDASGEDIGAAWLRRWAGTERGFGFVAYDVPELSLAVRPGHRGRGVGTQMLSALLGIVDKRGWSVSLSVDRRNPALRLYRRFGFEEDEGRGDSLTMVRQALGKVAGGGRPARRSPLGGLTGRMAPAARRCMQSSGCPGSCAESARRLSRSPAGPETRCRSDLPPGFPARGRE